MSEVSGNGDWLFSFVPIVIGIIFIIVFIGVVVNLFKGVTQWKKNEDSPRLTVSAIVKSKRTHITRYINHQDQNMHSNDSSTRYFVTFEFDSGDRSEFKVSDKEYGMLAEGDIGTLIFQGTRYIDFDRTKLNNRHESANSGSQRLE